MKGLNPQSRQRPDVQIEFPGTMLLTKVVVTHTLTPEEVWATRSMASHRRIERHRTRRCPRPDGARATRVRRRGGARERGGEGGDQIERVLLTCLSGSRSETSGSAELACNHTQYTVPFCERLRHDRYPDNGAASAATTTTNGQSE